MKIDRQEFLQELRMREQIRKAIRVIRERRQTPESTTYRIQLKEELRLRQVIRKLLKEEGEGDESTGIAFLRRDLKKISEMHLVACHQIDKINARRVVNVKTPDLIKV